MSMCALKLKGKAFCVSICTRGCTCMQDFGQGGQTWSMSKRRGARLFVAAGQPQGGGCIWKFKGGENNSSGEPRQPLNTPLCTIMCT